VRAEEIRDEGEGLRHQSKRGERKNGKEEESIRKGEKEE
jgi:hypothetical protein